LMKVGFIVSSHGHDNIDMTGLASMRHAGREGGTDLPQRILIVDDDRKITELLRAYLEKEGFIIETAGEGYQALEAAESFNPDLILLDLMLPGLDGWQVLRRVHQGQNVPVIMLTARDQETDRVLGLELGADDYVVKPFSPREVVARVKAVLRRAGGIGLGPGGDMIRVGGITIDIARHSVFREGQLLELTPTEFKLLHTLAGQPGWVFTRLQLIDQVQGYSFEGYERTVDAHIKNLRRKLESDPRNPQYIITVYGVGYKMGGGLNA